MNSELLYWIFVLVIFVSLLYRYRRNSFFILILLFFFEGLFTYFGQTTWNFYKIFLPVFALYTLIRKNKPFRTDRKEKLLILVFVIFAIFFFISSYINDDPILLFLNQFSRYLMPVVSFIILRSYEKKGITFNNIEKLIKTILNWQIAFSLLNFILMGTHENIVGSMSSNGGALATILPVLGLMFIWLRNDGRMERKDWIYFVLLLFIGFVSMKRAVWIIAPLFALLLVFYVPRKKISGNLLLIIPLLPLVFYFGIRLNPTLNPDAKLWGRFDFDFFYNYSVNYTFGTGNDNGIHVGRGSATLLTIENIFTQDISFLGNGLKNIYAWEEGIEENQESPILISQLNSITMATGIFQNYYAGGLFGMFSFLLLVLSLIFLVREKRLRTVLIILYVWEYLLYTNTLIRQPGLSFMFVFIIVYSNVKYMRNPVYFRTNYEKAADNIPGPVRIPY